MSDDDIGRANFDKKFVVPATFNRFFLFVVTRQFLFLHLFEFDFMAKVLETDTMDGRFQVTHTHSHTDKTTKKIVFQELMLDGKLLCAFHVVRASIHLTISRRAKMLRNKPHVGDTKKGYDFLIRLSSHPALTLPKCLYLL